EAPKKKSIQELAKAVRLNKVVEKPLIMNESTDSISSVLTNRAKRMWRPAKVESLEEKVTRLEAEISKKKLINEEKVHFSGPVQGGHTFEVVDHPQYKGNSDQDK